MQPNGHTPPADGQHLEYMEFAHSEWGMATVLLNTHNERERLTVPSWLVVNVADVR